MMLLMGFVHSIPSVKCTKRITLARWGSNRFSHSILFFGFCHMKHKNGKNNGSNTHQYTDIINGHFSQTKALKANVVVHEIFTLTAHRSDTISLWHTQIPFIAIVFFRFLFYVFILSKCPSIDDATGCISE